MAGPTIIPIFIPQQGCPCQCIYCLKAVVGGGTADAAPDPEALVADACRFFRGQGVGQADELAFYGGTFTLLPAERQVRLLEAAVREKDRGYIRRIRLSTRPDAIDRETCARLAFYQVKLVELGVQSLDARVLAASGRDYEPRCVVESQEMLRDAGIEAAFQLMLGLPRQNWRSVIETARAVQRLRPAGVRIYPLLVFKGTALAAAWRAGAYRPLPLRTAVAQASYWRSAFADAKIPVFRIGLQLAQPELRQVAAGPWHPSFAALVAAHGARAVLGGHLDGLADSQACVRLSLARGKRSAVLQQDKPALIQLLKNHPDTYFEIANNDLASDYLIKICNLTEKIEHFSAR